jgi:hypothetical protein
MRILTKYVKLDQVHRKICLQIYDLTSKNEVKWECNSVSLVISIHQCESKSRMQFDVYKNHIRLYIGDAGSSRWYCKENPKAKKRWKPAMLSLSTSWL